MENTLLNPKKQTPPLGAGGLSLISYNLNGIRSALSKGFLDWLKNESYDLIGLQEIKLSETELVAPLFEGLGYHCYWYPAEKKGYSGVAILSKQKPTHVEYGMGIDIHDSEGRVIRTDFENFSFVSVYLPSSSAGEHRQTVKYQFMDDFFVYLENLRKNQPNLIVGGDFNICHQEIDIHNPKANANTGGFLPDERAWLSKFVAEGWVDSFRHFCPDPHHYSWWSFRAGARQKNLGWRIDYLFCTEAMKPVLKSANILPEVHFSDHCPVAINF